MGEIVAFKRMERPSTPPGAEAKILWFTGVRYVRFESVEETAVPTPPRPRRTKRPSTRRRDVSVVA